MFGLSLPAFTLVHVVISLIGLATGFVALYGQLTGSRMDRMTAIFLIFTVLTSITGFLFPFVKLLPSHVVGIISLVILAIAIPARYAFDMKGHWRWIYIVSAGVALYLNAFVGVVQSFLKIPFLHTLAPEGTEPPFAVAQLGLLAIFGVLIVLAAKRFRPTNLA